MGVDRYWEAQDELRQCPAKLAAANARIVELERELTELRAAKRADEDRIRQVVHDEAAKFEACVCMSSVRSELASRVASQLAGSVGVGLTAEDVATAKTLRDTLNEFNFLPEIPRAVALLDRLIASHRSTP